MDGITFLSKEAILEGPPSASIVSFYSIIIAVMFLIATGFMKKDNIMKKIFGILWCLSTISCVIAGLIYVCAEKPTGRYRYEVTLDDDVTFKYIYDHYEVIEHHGDIWVFEDKGKFDE